MQSGTIPNTLLKLAEAMGTEVKNRKLDIPAGFGSGYCIGFVFNEHIRMHVSNYELNQNIVIENPDINTSPQIIFFKFQNIFPETHTLKNENLSIKTPSVLIATSRINIDENITIHTNTATINIEVNADYLRSLFDLPAKPSILQSLLQNTQPLLFEQIIYPSLQKIVDEIITESAGAIFQMFFLRIKAEELICRLLMELEKRSEKKLYALNNPDIEIIYRIKEQMLHRLDVPPVISKLAYNANMSPTKLKRIFKQIFGKSIFDYYQGFRMKEAAILLKKRNLSVSEVGYHLGFTNLSHFSRIFEKYIGMKPKKYSTME